MIGSHQAGDSTMVPKASRTWGGLSAAMGTVRPSAPVCVPSMRRLTLPSGFIPAGFGKMKRWVSMEDLCETEITRQRVVPRVLDRILERLVQEIERQIRVHGGIAVGFQ